MDQSSNSDQENPVREEGPDISPETRVEPGTVSISPTPPPWLTHLRPIISLSLLLLAAGMPAWLVFQDRWLGKPVVNSFLSESWCQVPFFCQTSLPGYFASILVYSLVAILLLAVRRDSQLELPVFKGVFSSISNTPVNPDTYQKHLSLGLFIGAGASALIAIVISQIQAAIFGWGFFLALVLYVCGWIVWEKAWPRWSSWFWQHLDLLVACTLAHFAWIFFLADLNSWNPRQWGYSLLLIIALLNLSRYAGRIPPIFWVMNLSLLPLSWGANHWAYSVIGDDFMFFMRSSEIADTHSLWQIGSHLFDGILVYGSHPYLSTVLQVIPMKVLGSTNFAWRFSSIYLTALSLPFFFDFLRRFMPTRIAYLFVILLGGSSYLITFGKIGYNNLQALFAMALVLWAVSKLAEHRNRLAAVGAGLSLGFLFYVYPAAIYAAPAAILLLLFYYTPRSRISWQNWAVFFLSTLVLLLPLLLQPEYWQAKTPGTLFNNPEITTSGNSIFIHIAKNLFLSFWSFLFIPSETHFVAVGYMDVISAILVIIGLGIVIRSAPRRLFLIYILITFVLLLFFVGASHDRPFPPTTRMFLILPVFILFAAIGLDWLVARLLAVGILEKSGNTLLSIFVALVIGLNLYQAYKVSPQRSLGQQTVEVLFLRVAENLYTLDRNSEYPKKIVFLTDRSWGIDGFILLQRVYGFLSSRLQVDRQVLSTPQWPADVSEMLAHQNTLVILQPSFPQDWQVKLGEGLTALGKLPCEVKENSGRDTRFVLWHSPNLAKVCDFK